MIDVRRLRTPEELEATKAALARKKVDPADVDRAARLDGEVRALVDERDQLRARRNALSKQVGQAMRDNDSAAADELKAESSRLATQEAELDADATRLQAELNDLLLRIPNLPSADAPDGDEDDFVVVWVRNEQEYGDHQRVPHWEIGAALGILDTERAVKISGSMFTMLRGMGATLSRALCQLALDRNADAFEEIRPPTLVTSDTLTATGQLPKFADEAYHIERDDLWCIPTAEVPLTSLARDEILDEADLPMRLMAYTPCYRREAGAAGRDTRGLLRGHEFDKVEVLAYCKPEDGALMHGELVDRAVGTIAALGLQHRLIEIPAGDLGQSHHRQFDLEVYSPALDRWLEVSSISWFTDYQARRANIRYRNRLDEKSQASAAGSGRRVELVHTLNGSALAVPRVLAAILEVGRRPDGTIEIPEALHPYTRGVTVLLPKV